ncbi:hypothetical protein [Lentzea cavernae]|uniref:Uncharacterized protein n=1 Tax=Lentzea cavernae TaxID=2020703 RepID=A0ABQ3MBD9_9PSEU|nr:hypothetical protein [Lentzea cavernae]GHH36460.1 hypothetical protein GCM10017774_23320 [Lentzea cavernae]
MSEQEIREGMLLAVWDEPPLDFDPDTLIRRVEQKKSRRRALVAVGVATAVIAVASFSLPGLLPRENRDSQLAADNQTSASPAPAEAAEKKAQRIGDRLAASLGARTPSFKEIYASFGPGRNAVYRTQQTQPPEWRHDEKEYSGFLYLTDGIGPTALQVTVSRRTFTKNNYCAGAPLCQEVKQKDGSTVHQVEQVYASPQVQQASVAREFDSGLIVEISSFAYNPSNGVGQRETVPVRVGVLTDLVTDPDISWE